MSREIRAFQIAIACSIIDALGNTTELMVSVVNLFVVRLSERPPDDDHTYGHAKVEGLGAMFVHDLYLALRAQIRSVVGPTTKVLMHADPAG